MLKNIITGMLLFSMIILPRLAVCQDPPKGKWWHDSQMSRQLNLTEEEKIKLDEQFVESHRRLIDLKRNVERERFELNNLLDSKKMDEDAVKKQFKKLEKSRSDLAEERFKSLMKSRKILGSERFQTVKQMYKKNRYDKRNKKDKKERSVKE